MVKLFSVVCVAGALALPSVSSAGGYGTAGVSDARVGQSAVATATLWCPRLNAEVPLELVRQMDCGDGVAVGSAQPAVAPARIRRGPFGLPPHDPSRLEEDRNDPDNDPVVVVSTNPSPNDNGSDDNDNSDPNDNTSDPNNNDGFVDKWTALGDYGVTQDNYDQQPPEVMQPIEDYFNAHGGDGDWSGFSIP